MSTSQRSTAQRAVRCGAAALAVLAAAGCAQLPTPGAAAASPVNTNGPSGDGVNNLLVAAVA